MYFKKIQLIYFKRIVTIVLRKLSKKNNSKLFNFKLIALLNIFKKDIKINNIKAFTFCY
jgi:hypothetical protein